MELNNPVMVMLYFRGPHLQHIRFAILVNQRAQVFFFRGQSDHKSEVDTWHLVRMDGGTVWVGLCPCVTAPRRFTSLPITGGGVYFFKFYPNKQTKK